MADCKIPTIGFKRGDDFKLDFTVEDTNNTTAIAAKTALDTEIASLKTLQNADPVDPVAVAVQQVIVDTAQAVYDSVIIVDITGWTMISQVRRADKLVDTLDITLIDAATGKFALSKDKIDTALWPVYTLQCDVQFTRPEGTVSSETFHIDVQRDVTR